MDKLNWGMKACGVFLLCATTAVAVPAQTFTRLHSFDYKDGFAARAALVQGIDGDLYGTTAFGGGNSATCVGGCGTVFKLNPSGKLTPLHRFCSQKGCTDGMAPRAALVQATDGNFYGTTYYGGKNSAGTVFQITPGGTLTTLYYFCAKKNCTDGQFPDAELIQATDGNLYGTTTAGGTGASPGGTVFKITPGGALTTLHSFYTDGFGPSGGLVQGTDGDFYGTTGAGGPNGLGTVFKITPSGTVTILHTFNGTDGAGPAETLVQATDGNFYGTTSSGGTNFNGTVFKITPGGTLTTLYRFCSQGGNNCTDGSAPQGGLVQATDGNFYGTTSWGGSLAEGTAFKVTPSGTLTTLYNFYRAPGVQPVGGLVQATNGNLYGTTYYGGVNGAGTVFSLSVDQGPFVETLPATGETGASVRILGTGLTGATSVTFNGAAAVFTVTSSSLITTTVPAGATSGTVQVVTPGGTLSSNVPFTVN